MILMNTATYCALTINTPEWFFRRAEDLPVAESACEGYFFNPVFSEAWGQPFYN
jgi:hypothetical protein